MTSSRRLILLAHEGAKAYGEEFDLVYRREASHANAMWQADHSFLPILLLDEHGKSAKPWLTAILDDYSRAVAGYFLGFQTATALQTALTLHQAIWRKEDPRGHVCGIPSTFYTDHGSDFISLYVISVVLIGGTIGSLELLRYRTLRSTDRSVQYEPEDINISRCSLPKGSNEPLLTHCG